MTSTHRVLVPTLSFNGGFVDMLGFLVLQGFAVGCIAAALLYLVCGGGDRGLGVRRRHRERGGGR
ncbi:hypothetical protein [Pseudomonas sp. 6D_7.1_Bac1]|uniref:hypothetical protein n=1 Tax=Pseudomonas sp. 6D_7.1_Bac1 TaxID=2971615 RepID=UPI0021C65EFF|nr:hypothetical protein [Pseudomonas sp. 6D_7.1_Bac1]MCU1753047.1 hypothetical protein [Pseudomonas sp. 6D_7.1_Bac1]